MYRRFDWRITWDSFSIIWRTIGHFSRIEGVGLKKWVPISWQYDINTPISWVYIRLPVGSRLDLWLYLLFCSSDSLFGLRKKINSSFLYNAFLVEDLPVDSFSWKETLFCTPDVITTVDIGTYHVKDFQLLVFQWWFLY